MIVDAHHHFWRLGENDCTWPTPDLVAIHRNFEPADLALVASAAGVTGTVLVQSQESDRDTDWLLDLAERCNLVKAVVGWADIKHANAPTRIAALAKNPKLRGIRPMLQHLPVEWILDRALDPAIEAMMAHDLVFEALVYPRHLPALRGFALRHPRLRIVIDHGAKPPIAGGALDPWRADIAKLAELPTVFCKLSGFPTEAAPGQGARVMAPYARHLLALFGPPRLMWGSDWPVLNLASTYEGWLDLARTLVGPIRPAGLAALFGGTAISFYRL